MASAFDVLIIGAGAAGTFAAMGAHATGASVAVLDYGNDCAGEVPAPPSLAALRNRPELRNIVLGDDLRGAERVFYQRSATPKLTAPLMRFVTDRATEWDKAADEFRAIRSFAKGGLANVWGAQVYRFGDQDLREYPFTAEELAPYYDRVCTEVGISGSATDDLAAFHGREPHLQPEVQGSELTRRLIRRYTRKRELFARRGIRIGKPRLAVLTQAYRGREPLRYDNLEFLVPRNPAYYSPHLTLDRLVAEQAVRYISRHQALRFEESANGVTVIARHVDSGVEEAFHARKVILCLGCLNTARLVLDSYGDYETRLPLLETPMTFTPLVDVTRLGAAHEEHTYSSDLSLAIEDPAYPTALVGMIYNLDGMVRSGLLFDLPVAAHVAVEAMRLVTPALLALQLYYPQGATSENRLWIDRAGGCHFSYRYEHDFRIERTTLAALRRIGFISATRLSKLAPPGDSLHYGGSIPMKAAPQGRYQSDRFGQLNGTRHVFVGDAAGFPYLPAKNLTYTIMANACRIGEYAGRAVRAAGSASA